MVGASTASIVSRPVRGRAGQRSFGRCVFGDDPSRTPGGTSTEAAADARAALDLARDRGLVWLEVVALWAMAATEDVGRGLFDDDPPPPGLPPRAGSFADQAGRLRQRLNNQWFDLHPLRTVEQRVGR